MIKRTTVGLTITTISHFKILCIALVIMISWVSVAPAQDTDIVTEKSFFNRKRLTGNWGGIRDQLAENGVSVNLEFTEYYQGIISNLKLSGNIQFNSSFGVQN